MSRNGSAGMHGISGNVWLRAGSRFGNRAESASSCASPQAVLNVQMLLMRTVTMRERDKDKEKRGLKKW